jgi:cell division ATPase FtsA
VFKKGNLIFSAVIPLGGDHVTADIAQILKIPTDEAERVKKKYGSAVPELADQDLTLELTKSGMVTSVSPFDLSRIIKPRVAEIFNFVRNEIDASLGPVEMISQNVVLTGGSSLMRGIVELARERFKLPVRVGKPRGIAGLIEVVSSPTHATAVGLVRYGLTQPLSRGATVQAAGQGNMGARVEQQQPVLVGANGASMNGNQQSENIHFDSDDLEHESDVRAASLWDRIKLALKDFF